MTAVLGLAGAALGLDDVGTVVEAAQAAPDSEAVAFKADRGATLAGEVSELGDAVGDVNFSVESAANVAQETADVTEAYANFVGTVSEKSQIAANMAGFGDDVKDVLDFTGNIENTMQNTFYAGVRGGIGVGASTANAAIDVGSAFGDVGIAFGSGGPKVSGLGGVGSAALSGLGSIGGASLTAATGVGEAVGTGVTNAVESNLAAPVVAVAAPVVEAVAQPVVETATAAVGAVTDFFAPPASSSSTASRPFDALDPSTW